MPLQTSRSNSHSKIKSHSNHDKHHHTDDNEHNDEKTILEYFYDTVARMGNKPWLTQPMGRGCCNDNGEITPIDDNYNYFGGGSGDVSIENKNNNNHGEGDDDNDYDDDETLLGLKIIHRWTFHDALVEAKKIAAYLQQSYNFLPPKSQIAICSQNCAWWLMADIAIWMAGHVSVPIDPSLSPETTRFILNHTESKLIFIGKLHEDTWSDLKHGIPRGIPTISFPVCPEEFNITTTNTKTKTKTNTNNNNQNNTSWIQIVTTMDPIAEPKKRSLDEMATIIYTSGITLTEDADGRPKGIMTSFKALTVATKGFSKVNNVTSDDRYLSYLPIANSMERWLGECVCMYSGVQVYFTDDSLVTFLEDLNRCRPTIFLAVPRIWTKFHDYIVFNKMKKFDWLLKIPLLDRNIKGKTLKLLGLDKCRWAGSSIWAEESCSVWTEKSKPVPIPQDIHRWYHKKLGLEVLEGYGRTEMFHYSHTSRHGRCRFGYVGEPYDDDDVQQRIVEDDGSDEIQVKTPGMMMGYYKNIQATNEVITKDGWIKTGDKGELDVLGRLKITGRVVTSTTATSTNVVCGATGIIGVVPTTPATTTTATKKKKELYTTPSGNFAGTINVRI